MSKKGNRPPHLILYALVNGLVWIIALGALAMVLPRRW